jgi:Na+/H+ antiporter NhaD/arsenite permease-like protein
MTWAVLAVFVLTYAGIAFTRLPWMPLDRPTAAFTGAVAMLALGALSLDAAVEAIDFHTIGLLLGMMLVAAALERGGTLAWLAEGAARRAGSPHRLLALVIAATAVASALLVNDVVVLVFTPIIVRAARALRVDPVPYLVAEALAANAGSLATVVGNPQNILVGLASGISFPRFFLVLAPIAVAGCLCAWAAVRIAFRRSLSVPVGSAPAGGEAMGRPSPAGLALVGLTAAAFFASSAMGWDLAVIALVAGAAAMLLPGVRPAQVVAGVDWALLLLFAALFVVVGAAGEAGLLGPLTRALEPTGSLAGLASVHGAALAGSQVVSNVPFTLLATPVLEGAPEAAWLALASGATLAGNLTLVGAVANLIVAERAGAMGARVGFGVFLRAGALATLPAVALSTLWLWVAGA